LEGHVISELQRDADLDQVGKRPQSDVAATASLVHVGAYDPTVKPVVEAPSRHASKSEYLFAGEDLVR